MSNPPTLPAPSGVLVDLLGRYLPPGYVVSLIRTWVPVGLGSLLAYAAVHWHVAVSPHASAAAGVFAAAVVVAGYYALARLVEHRWPAIGRWLVALNLVQTAGPMYLHPDAQVTLTSPDTGTHREP